MSANKRVMLAVAGAGALGTAYYTARKTNQPALQSPEYDNKARDKRDMGLSGAGIGRTAAAGGTERAIDPSKDRKTQTTAPPEKLPSGSIGGGPGAGGTNARAVELPMPGASSSIGGQSSSEPKSRSNLPKHNGNPHLEEAEDGGKQQLLSKV